MERADELRLLNTVVTAVFRLVSDLTEPDRFASIYRTWFSTLIAFQLAFLRGYFIGRRHGQFEDEQLFGYESETLANQLMYLLFAHDVGASA